MLLEGKKGLVLNVMNKNSIGWAIADAANQHGAVVGIGGQNERLMDGVYKLIGDRERFDQSTRPADVQAGDRGRHCQPSNGHPLPRPGGG